jgi:SEC-C motif domain protein
MSPCPCGSGLDLADCCGRWQAERWPDSPEALMRSRYSAYLRGDRAWLLSTWHPRTRPPSLALEPATRWLGLKIVSAPGPEGETATVHFIARWRLGGAPAQRQEEISRFVFEQGRWWYLDGEVRSR